MESIATKGIKDLARIFQPLDPELQEIHLRKPFEIRDGLWYSGGQLVIPKVSGPDIDRTEGSSPLRSGDHFKHQVNTLDTRVDATNLITNTINLIIIDATNLIINPINLIIIDITNLITNTINLIIINTHTRPWCHHNIDIDRAELPLNGVSTEVS
ncbi:hypothetical protein NDA10_001828 [Ustilago hordei]|nr:hypothetical protein NDA10_001828 [Ustilago hordei]